MDNGWCHPAPVSKPSIITVPETLLAFFFNIAIGGRILDVQIDFCVAHPGSNRGGPHRRTQQARA
jgi:hypothetical protein